MTGGSEPLDTRHGQYVPLPSPNYLELSFWPALEKAFTYTGWIGSSVPGVISVCHFANKVFTHKSVPEPNAIPGLPNKQTFADIKELLETMLMRIGRFPTAEGHNHIFHIRQPTAPTRWHHARRSL